MADVYLAGLDLHGRRVVIVGGGRVAQRRLGRLLTAGADVVMIAPEATARLTDQARRGEFALRRKDFESADLDGAWYVIACTDAPEVNAAVVTAATAQRVFCVRADDAPRGTAVTPAVGQRNGLTIGVLAGGDPRRSAGVRNSIVDRLDGDEIGTEPVDPADTDKADADA